MRSIIAGVFLLTGTITGRADMVETEAGRGLDRFLTSLDVRYEIVSFMPDSALAIYKTKRLIRYHAVILFPDGLNPAARAALSAENLRVLNGRLTEISSKPVRLEIWREDAFVAIPSFLVPNPR